MQPTEQQLIFIREFQRKERSWVGVQMTPLSNGALEVFCKAPPKSLNFRAWATGYFIETIYGLFGAVEESQVHYERFSSAFDCHVFHIFV